MKIHYSSVKERIDDAIVVAEQNEDYIDYIELSEREWFQFRREINISLYEAFNPAIRRANYQGIEIRRQNET